MPEETDKDRQEKHDSITERVVRDLNSKLGGTESLLEPGDVMTLKITHHGNLVLAAVIKNGAALMILTLSAEEALRTSMAFLNEANEAMTFEQLALTMEEAENRLIFTEVDDLLRSTVSPQDEVTDGQE